MKPPAVKRKIFASVFAVFVTGAMALFFNLYEPWLPIGPELIPAGSFSTPAATNGWSGWNGQTRLVSDGGFDGSPGVVLTTSPDQHGILRFTTYDLKNIPAFRVSIRAAAYGVVCAKEKYHVPRVIFFFNDAHKKSLYGLHHGVAEFGNDCGWKRYVDYFPVPKEAADARLHIQNMGDAGTLQIDDVSVTPVRERPSAPWWKLFFGTLWMTAFGLCLFTLRPWMRRFGIPIMLVLTVIMTGIVLPGELLDSSIEKALHTAKRLTPAPAPSARQAPAQPSAPPPFKPKTDPVIPQKEPGVNNVHVLGHFVLFSLLAFLSALSWIEQPLLWRRSAAVLAGLLLFAAATEVLQFIPPERTAGLDDLSVDAAGMTGAVILVCLWRLINRD